MGNQALDLAIWITACPLRAAEPIEDPQRVVRYPYHTFHSTTVMSESLRHRTSLKGAQEAENAGETLLHALEDFQSHIHSDPIDKPDAPPEQEPTKTSSLTLTWHEIPAWQKDNEYILTGYRRLACDNIIRNWLCSTEIQLTPFSFRIQNSWRGCAASVFTCM